MKRLVIIILLYHIAFWVYGQENLFDNHKRSIGFFYQNNYSNSPYRYNESYWGTSFTSGVYTFGTGFNYQYQITNTFSFETGLEYLEFGYKINYEWENGFYIQKTHGNMTETKIGLIYGFLSIPIKGQIYFQYFNWRIAISAGLSLNHLVVYRTSEYHLWSDNSHDKHYDFYIGPFFSLKKNALYGLEDYTYGAMSIGYSIEHKLGTRCFFNIAPEFQVLPVFRLNGKKVQSPYYNISLQTGIHYILK